MNIVKTEITSLTITKVLLLFSAISLVCGLFLPLLTVTKFVLISNTFSVMGGVWQLWQGGQIFLFLVISIFSIVIPIIKLLLVSLLVLHPSAAIASSNKSRHLLKFIHLTGKWSMLDVFVVAVLVVAVKLAGLASVQMELGLYFFTAAVLLTMALTQQLWRVHGHPDV